MKKWLFFGVMSIVSSAQTTISISANPTSVQVNVPTTITLSLNADGRTATMLNWQYAVGLGQVTLGPSVMSASSLTSGKSGQCNTSALICGIFGVNTAVVPIPSLNVNVLAGGALQSQTMTFKTAGSFPVSLTNLAASDPNGSSVPVSSGPAVTIVVAGPVNKFDLNGDGIVNNADVTLAIGQALGNVSCTNADVNSDGKCNVQDVQLVIRAALGI